MGDDEGIIHLKLWEVLFSGLQSQELFGERQANLVLSRLFFCVEKVLELKPNTLEPFNDTTVFDHKLVVIYQRSQKLMEELKAKRRGIWNEFVTYKVESKKTGATKTGRTVEWGYEEKTEWFSEYWKKYGSQEFIDLMDEEVSIDHFGPIFMRTILEDCKRSLDKIGELEFNSKKVLEDWNEWYQGFRERLNELIRYCEEKEEPNTFKVPERLILSESNANNMSGKLKKKYQNYS
jgi:hypothetical protein